MFDNSIIAIGGAWRIPFDRRHPYKDFKIKDIESAEIFMGEALIIGNEYIIPDLNNGNMYYTLSKEKDGKVIMAHTEYGRFNPQVMLYDNVAKRIYNARKSINHYFFDRED